MVPSFDHSMFIYENRIIDIYSWQQIDFILFLQNYLRLNKLYELEKNQGSDFCIIITKYGYKIKMSLFHFHLNHNYNSNLNFQKDNLPITSLVKFIQKLLVCLVRYKTGHFNTCAILLIPLLHLHTHIPPFHS